MSLFFFRLVYIDRIYLCGLKSRNKILKFDQNNIYVSITINVIWFSTLSHVYSEEKVILTGSQSEQ